MSSPGRIRFSPQHGCNVAMGRGRRQAVWNIRYHGGCCVLNRPLRSGEHIAFNICGNGHVIIGHLPFKPDVSSFDPQNCQEAQHNRMYLRIFKTELYTTISKDERTVTIMERRNGTKMNTLMMGPESYVFVEILFGDLTVNIEQGNLKPEVKFGEYGDNILLRNNAKRIKLRRNNVGSLVCTERPICEGEELNVRIRPLKDANWVKCKVFVSNAKPEDFEISSLVSSGDLRMKLISLVKVEREQTLHMQLNNGRIKYIFNMHENTHSLQELDKTQPIYIYFSLFRMSLKIDSFMNKEIKPYLKMQDQPQNCMDPLSGNLLMPLSSLTADADMDELAVPQDDPDETEVKAVHQDNATT